MRLLINIIVLSSTTIQSLMRTHPLGTPMAAPMGRMLGVVR